MTGCRIGKVTLKTPDNVVILPLPTSGDIPASRVLAGALNENLASVYVIGLDRNGNEYFAGTSSDAGLAVLLVERFKHMILQAAGER